MPKQRYSSGWERRLKVARMKALARPEFREPTVARIVSPHSLLGMPIKVLDDETRSMINEALKKRGLL